LTYLGRRPAGVEHPDKIENADELYVPDFLKLAGAYGIKGIRVGDEAEIVPALEEAKKAQLDGKSMLVEFEIAPEDVVLPMVKGGMANSDMILK
ncbi:MAG: thiamine pyrophosphate-dependent enzyme, partial [Candidatus Weimeria sp.]